MSFLHKVKGRFSAARFCLDVALLAFVAMPCIGLAMFFRHSGHVRERFGRQIYTADAIGRALVTYENEHKGLVPASIGSLNVNKEVPSDETLITEKDLSQFHLLPPGTRSGMRPVDVVFEAVEQGFFPQLARMLDPFPNTTVRIYRDGEALSELTDVSHKGGG